MSDLVCDLVHQLVDQYVNRQSFELGNELWYMNRYMHKKDYVNKLMESVNQ